MCVRDNKYPGPVGETKLVKERYRRVSEATPETSLQWIKHVERTGRTNFVVGKIEGFGKEQNEKKSRKSW